MLFIRLLLTMMNKFLILFAIGAVMFFSTRSKMVRGLRNNNAGNIRWDEKTQWVGMTGSDDKGFIIFSEPKFGVRAMARVLKSYSRRGVRTVRDIISTWAPTNENDTESYIKSVTRKTGFDEFYPVTESDYSDLIAAIIFHENGEQPYSQEEIKQGIGLA